MRGIFDNMYPISYDLTKGADLLSTVNTGVWETCGTLVKKLKFVGSKL